MRKAILTKPLDGKPEGSVVELANTDFDMLEELGAVKAAPQSVEAKSEPAPDNKAERVPQNKSAAKPK